MTSFLLGYLLGAFATFWVLSLYFHDRIRRAEKAAEVWEEATTELIDELRVTRVLGVRRYVPREVRPN